MSDFTRELRQLESLRNLTKEAGPNWWTDLLKYWRPSGSTAQGGGLRLAIRNDYLNFYSCGQSVARVEFGPDHQPYVATHVKYAFGNAETSQAYARLDGTTIRHPKNGIQSEYKGEETLRNWISCAAEHHGKEKTFVDELVSDNASIIDLEMGLPANDEKKNAQRMDCVALERDGDSIRIVFWEAKLIDDSRLRAREEPKVIGQLKIYQDYLAGRDPERVRIVQDAYRNVCHLLTELGAMATSCGNDLKIDSLIEEASRAGSNLKVDPEPRLVIFGRPKKGNWELHEEKLGIIPRLIFSGDRPYTLHKPEMKV